MLLICLERRISRCLPDSIEMAGDRFWYESVFFFVVSDDHLHFISFRGFSVRNCFRLWSMPRGDEVLMTIFFSVLLFIALCLIIRGSVSILCFLTCARYQLTLYGFYDSWLPATCSFRERSFSPLIHKRERLIKKKKIQTCMGILFHHHFKIILSC